MTSMASKSVEKRRILPKITLGQMAVRLERGISGHPRDELQILEDLTFEKLRMCWKQVSDGGVWFGGRRPS